MWKTIFTIPMSSSNPTPTPTVAMSSVPFITAFTCWARTVRSGSAMVIRRPIPKPTLRRIPIFLEAVRPWPMYCPMGVMAISAPRLKRPIPSTSSTAATTNTKSSMPEMSAQGVMDRMNTNRLTGITDTRDSLSFSLREARMAVLYLGVGLSIVLQR